MYIDIKDQHGDNLALPVVVEIAGRLFASVEHLGSNLMAGFYGESDSYELNTGSEQNGSVLAQIGGAWKVLDEGTEREKKAVKLAGGYEQFLSSAMHFVEAKYKFAGRFTLWQGEGKQADAKTLDFQAFIRALNRLDTPTEAKSGSSSHALAVDLLFYIFWDHLPGEYSTPEDHAKLSELCNGKACLESEKIALHWSGHQPPASEQASQNVLLNNGSPTVTAVDEGSQ